MNDKDAMFILKAPCSFLICCTVVATAVAQQQPEVHWYKGNTHTHTLNSDGDSTPDDVVRWYRQHGYDFLFVTDHDVVTNVDPLNSLFGGDSQFLVIRGEEVTSNFNSPELHVHVNALNPNRKIQAQKGIDPRDTLQKDLDVIRATGGLAQINHPNFFWQLTAEDIAAVKGARLLEIANMHPVVNTLGAGLDAPSAEQIWDQALSRGAVLWGVASDDTHELKEGSLMGTAGAGAGPGKGWIVVRAEHLTTAEIMKAIDKGVFYASTGVELEDYAVTSKQITIKLKPHDRFKTKYRVQFFGKNERVLQEETATSSTYSIKGDEGHVRVRVTDSNGKMAWTQPVFVRAGQPRQ